jgi:hypothetical protein
MRRASWHNACDSASVSAGQTGFQGGKELGSGGGAVSIGRRLPRRVATPRRLAARLRLELQLFTRAHLLSTLAQRALTRPQW